MSKTIKSDSDARKAAYRENKKAKTSPSYFHRTQYDEEQKLKARLFAKAVNKK